MANFLVYTSKGGVGKSTTAREIIASIDAKKFTLIEIDSLNKTQLIYKDKFNDVIEVDKNDIQNVMTYLNEFENCVIDVGADNLSKTLNTFVEFGIFEDINKTIIPVMSGRDECQNAIKTYSEIVKHTSNIMFAFCKYNKNEKLQDQYEVFFNNIDKVKDDFNDDDYVLIDDSDLFVTAHNQKKLVTELANDIDYKNSALTAKESGDMSKFYSLMRDELNKRSAQILLNNCIIPANKKILSEDLNNE